MDKEICHSESDNIVNRLFLRNISMESKIYNIPTLLLRAGGVASVLAGALMILGFAFHPKGEDATFGTDPLWVPAHGLLWLAFTVAVLGWIGLYIAEASKAGKLGVAGFVSVVLGTSLASWIFSSDVTYVPVIAAEYPTLFQDIFNVSHILVGVLSVLFWVLGCVIFGLSVIRAHVFPKWAGGLLVVGTLLVPFAYLAGLPEKVVVAGGIIAGGAQVWLGYTLLRLLGR